MIVEKDVEIVVADGSVLYANVFRPDDDGKHPVLMCMGIYGKDIHFEDGYSFPWKILMAEHPEVATEKTSGKWLRWEMPDPERWVPEGYAIVTVDARGSGKSPGYLDPFSAVETSDYYDAIEWAGVQSWSTGKVGLLGISYLAITQWQVAGLRPPHLAAICPWEGGSDIYRDWSHQGGILSYQFPLEWLPRQVYPNQHGNPETTHFDRDTGERTTGAAAFSEAQLRGNRADHVSDLLHHPLDDEWYRERSPKLDRIDVPLLSAGNWGGLGLHLRGNIEGYKRAASRHKWLFIHAGRHYESFYLTQYIDVQRQFFDRFLKGEQNGWEAREPVQLEIRRPDGVEHRAEMEWPLERTRWTRYFLHCDSRTMSTTEPASAASLSYDAFAEGVHFSTQPFPQELEFTGPIGCRIFASSQTTDMDLFLTVRLFDPDNNEIVIVGASEDVPVTRGWLRASHRKLDPARSTPAQPFLSHDVIEPLVPGEIVALDIEVWPTSIVVPKGYRLSLTVQGRDFEFPSKPGRMLHNSAIDRPADIYGGDKTLYSAPNHLSYLLMPLIPPTN
jgi:predicted acyl esterase